jgi:hypothetical protein
VKRGSWLAQATNCLHLTHLPSPYQFSPLTTVLHCTCWALLSYLIDPLLIQPLLLSAQVFFSDRVLWKACIFPIVSGSLNAPNLVQGTLCSSRARPDSADLSFVVHPQKTGLSRELNYRPRNINLRMCSLKNRSKVCMRERCIKLAQVVSNCCVLDCTYKNFCFLRTPPSKSSLAS